MREDSALYGRWFDRLLSLPLFIYLGMIVVLVAGIFAALSPAALREAFRERALLEAIRLSLITSVASVMLSMAFAIPAGYVLSRHRFPGRVVVDTILDMPIILPPLVMGLCVLIFFNTPVGRAIDRGIVRDGLFVYQPLGIVLVQFLIGCAYAVRVVKSGFDALDPRLEEMAMALGATRHQSFVKIALPNVAPSLVAGAVICWAHIFGLFGPVILVCGTMRGRTEIMPTTIFLETSIGRIDVALVISALMILMSMTALVALKNIGKKTY